MNECFVQRILIFLFFPLCFEKLTPWLGFCLLPCSECARARPESRQAGCAAVVAAQAVGYTAQ